MAPPSPDDHARAAVGLLLRAAHRILAGYCPACQAPVPHSDPARPLAGRLVGCLKRASVTRNVGNFRWLEQDERLFERITALGGTPVLYDENEDGRGTSGRDLTKRKKALQLLADIDAGRIHDIGAYDIKRLTRDEFGADA